MLLQVPVLCCDAGDSYAPVWLQSRLASDGGSQIGEGGEGVPDPP